MARKISIMLAVVLPVLAVSPELGNAQGRGGWGGGPGWGWSQPVGTWGWGPGWVWMPGWGWVWR